MSAVLLMTALLFTQASNAEGEQPLSQMVPVAGHSLHVMSVGEGAFTMIFESGSGNDLSHWLKVAPAIGQTAKVVTLSRGGYGKSDAVAKARTLTESTNDLSGFIEKAELQPPFILVGHSYGSHIVRSYAAQHPNNVDGLVLVDPAYSDLEFLYN
jgi:pimeloyl-ACP methyl ester carboxylesterase